MKFLRRLKNEPEEKRIFSVLVRVGSNITTIAKRSMTVHGHMVQVIQLGVQTLFCSCTDCWDSIRHVRVLVCTT